MQMRITGLLLLAAAVVALPARAQDAPVYETPQDAVEALAAALATGDPARVGQTMGPDAGDLIADADADAPVDTDALMALHAEYRAGYRFAPGDDGRVVLEFGDDFWPFPVPLARAEGGWSFDLEAGAEEIAQREVGRNELDLLEVLQAYLEVQRLFRLVDHDGDGVMEFAASIISPDAQRTGLYWDGDDSPIGDLAARASLDGHSDDDSGAEAAHEPLFGYYLRVLSEQSEAAPGGAMSYLVNGNMVGGHALLAVPAEYGVGAVSSFMINEAGTVWEADLGEDSLDIAFDMESLDPDPQMGWAPLD